MNPHRRNTFILILNIAHMTQEDQCLVRYISEIFPLVSKHLKYINRHNDWIQFMHLISKAKYIVDVSNWLLDVSNLYSVDNVTAMHYNSTVKRFWTLGYTLLHERFISIWFQKIIPVIDYN